jgi:hypothetical protein
MRGLRAARFHFNSFLESYLYLGQRLRPGSLILLSEFEKKLCGRSPAPATSTRIRPGQAGFDDSSFQRRGNFSLTAKIAQLRHNMLSM